MKNHPLVSSQRSSLIQRLSLIVLLFGVLAVGGCTLDHSRQKTREWLRATEVAGYQRITTRRGWALSAQSPLYVARPRRGSGEFDPASTGIEAAEIPAEDIQRALCLALARYFPALTKGREAESLQGAARRARARAIPFVIYPVLRARRDGINSIEELDEDFVEFHQLGRDRLQLQLLLYDAANDRIIESASIDSRNPWFTWRRHKPEDLMSKAFARYARSLSAR